MPRNDDQARALADMARALQGIANVVNGILQAARGATGAAGGPTQGAFAGAGAAGAAVNGARGGGGRGGQGGVAGGVAAVTGVSPLSMARTFARASFDSMRQAAMIGSNPLLTESEKAQDARQASLIARIGRGAGFNREDYSGGTKARSIHDAAKERIMGGAIAAFHKGVPLAQGELQRLTDMTMRQQTSVFEIGEQVRNAIDNSPNNPLKKVEKSQEGIFGGNFSMQGVANTLASNQFDTLTQAMKDLTSALQKRSENARSESGFWFDGGGK